MADSRNKRIKPLIGYRKKTHPGLTHGSALWGKTESCNAVLAVRLFGIDEMKVDFFSVSISLLASGSRGQANGALVGDIILTG